MSGKYLKFGWIILIVAVLLGGGGLFASIVSGKEAVNGDEDESIVTGDISGVVVEEHGKVPVVCLCLRRQYPGERSH